MILNNVSAKNGMVTKPINVLDITRDITYTNMPSISPGKLSKNLEKELTMQQVEPTWKRIKKTI